MIEKIRNRHQTLLLFLLDVEGKDVQLRILEHLFWTVRHRLFRLVITVLLEVVL